MPMVMLKGVRQKRVKKFKEQKETNRNLGIHYNSKDKEFDVDFYEKKRKDKKMKNLKTEDKSYKFGGAKQGGKGTFSGGVLKLPSHLIKSINR